MGCATSKILTRSASLKEEFQKRLHRRRTDSYEEIIISKNGAEQFVAVLCSSRSNTVTTTLIKEHESSPQASIQKEEVEEHPEPENSVETINIWELLAGLEEDNEAKVEETEEPSESIIDPIKDDSETSQVVKGFKRKMAAKELPVMRVPAFEFSRTGSLRDWLSQGGQVFSPGSYVTPRFGSSEQASGNKDGFFDPYLVSQLEEAMEEMTVEEEKILKQII